MRAIMKKNRYLAVLIATVALGVLSQPGCNPGEVRADDVVASRASETGEVDTGVALPRMVGLYSPYCAVCMKMKPVVESLVSQCDYRGVRLEMVDVSSEENERLLDHYRVRAVPTVLFLDEYGIEVARLVGSQTEQSLKQALSVLRGKECPGMSLVDEDGAVIIGG